MKNAVARSKQLAGILKKIGRVEPPDLPDADDPIGVLVSSFLLWECNTERAATAYCAVLNNVVDYNDLRVCMPQELVEMIGVRYPKSTERCERLRATLRDIYSREHTVDLDRLSTIGKREIRKYIESLEGIVPYVSARLMLLCFDTHAIPVDEQLRDRLAAIEIIDPDIDVAEAASWLERQIKAEDGANAHHALQSWVESRKAKRGGGGRKQRTTGKSNSGRKTSSRKKSTARRTSKKSVAR